MVSLPGKLFPLLSDACFNGQGPYGEAVCKEPRDNESKGNGGVEVIDLLLADERGQRRGCHGRTEEESQDLPSLVEHLDLVSQAP
jgi:hypothetical protein